MEPTLIESTRLILKFLPKKIEEKEIKKFLRDFDITEVKLMYKPNGNFRRFAFVGVRDPKIAKRIISELNNTYLNTSKIEVDYATPVGTKTDDSNKRKVSEKPQKIANDREKINMNILEIDEDDKSVFEEFLSLHGVDPKLSRVSYVKKTELSSCKNNKSKENTLFGNENIKETENTLNLIDFGRIFIRNLPYDYIEDDIERFFEKIGPISQVHIVKDAKTSVSKGYGFVKFTSSADAIRACLLDGTSIGGRVLHIIPAETKPESFSKCGLNGEFKGKLNKNKFEDAELSWNSLFIGTKTIAGVASRSLGISKEKLLKDDVGKEPLSAAVKVAIVETDIVHRTKEFLLQNKVCLEAFNNKNTEKSKNVLIAKNLPTSTTVEDLEEFITDKCSHYENFIKPRIVLPPLCVSAILIFNSNLNATRAFKSLYFAKFKYIPFYLEWAPNNAISEENITANEVLGSNNIVYVKNLNFTTTEEALKKKFESVGTIISAKIARGCNKKSLGFGFIEFSNDREAREAVKKLQHCLLDTHALLLKISTSAQKKKIKTIREDMNLSNTEEAIIIVKNLPFEANDNEIRQLFRAYGRLKNVRLPKKLHENKEKHRGFCFVEFQSREDAEKAFEALRFSTHLYGRRLVLDWANRELNINHMRKKAECSTIEIQTKKKKYMQPIVDSID